MLRKKDAWNAYLAFQVVSVLDLGHNIGGWGFWFDLGLFVGEQFWPLLYFWQGSLTSALSHGHYLHIYTSLFHRSWVVFLHFRLPPPVSALDFNLFQSLYSLWLCILFNCLNKTRIERKSTAAYFLYSRSPSQTMSGLWHLIALMCFD